MEFYLIIILFLSIPIYGIFRMIFSLIGKGQKNGKIKWLDGIYVTVAFIVLGIGFSFNTFGIKGGEALSQYESGMTLDFYASLSNENISFVIFLFIAGFISYWVLNTKLSNRASPVIYAVCSVLLIGNVVYAILYFLHTGFAYYDGPIGNSITIVLLQMGYASLSFLYIARLKESLVNFLEAEKEIGEDTNPFIAFLYRLSFQYRRVPILWAVFLFPVLIIIQLILVLFGQRPDSFIRVFLDTSNFNYSRLPIPEPKIIPGDGHYLCTVSAKGHKKWVKPIRAGIRHGSRITVNRQLLIANAFENILEEYTPNAHKAIRGFYDRYGYPISRHIRSKWSANLVYTVMKPFEWFFLFVLYTVDKHPENRIHVQYSELRK